MEYFSDFLTIAVLHLIALASPGPDFAIVVKYSLTSGRRSALLASTGITLGLCLHVTYTLLGISLIISQSIIAFQVIKYLGAAYLVYLGVQGLRSRKKDGAVTRDGNPPGSNKALLVGFLTNVLNPKVTLFFLAVFSVAITPGTPIGIQVLYGLWMGLVSFLWFSALSFVISHQEVRNFFSSSRHWIDRVTGGALFALGIRLAMSKGP